MKKNNLLKVILITIGVMLVLTWIFPVAAFSGTYMEQGKAELGLFDLLAYPNVVMSYFGSILLFLLATGLFYGVLYKTGTYRLILDKIVKVFKKQETFFLVIAISVFAVLTSVFGVAIPLIAFFPLVISLVLMMGYNKVVAVSTTVGGVVAGLMGTTFGVTTVDMLNQALASSGQTIDVWTEILTKTILLVISVVLVVYSTVTYANKAKKDAKEETNFLIPEEVKVDKKDKKKALWPTILIIDLIVLIMLLGFFPWESVFGITIFTDATAAIKEFAIFDFQIFGKLLGNVAPFGYWTMIEVSYMLLIATPIIALINRVKFSDLCESASKGMKKALKPLLFVMLIYVVLVITTYHPFQLVITDFFLNLTGGFNLATTSIVAFLTSFFNVEMLYVAQSTIPYLITLVDVEYLPLIQVIFQAIYGVVMLVAPTSVVLVVALAYTKVSYFDWWKYVWKLFLMLLGISIGISLIIYLI